MMKRSQKILFLMPQWEAASEGWMQRMMHNIATNISAVAVSDSRGQKTWQDGIPVYSLSPRPREIRLLSSGARMGGFNLTFKGRDAQQRLAALLKKVNPDIVFCQYGAYAAEFMDVWRATTIPLFVHFHGYDATFDLRYSEDPAKRRFKPDYLEKVKELNRRATIISNSEFTRSLLIRAGIPDHRIAVKYFGITPAAEPHPQCGSGVSILHLGRLVDFKSPDRTIQAFELACSRGLNGRLTIAGDGPLRETCELLRLRSPWRDSIRIPGNVSTPDVEKLYREADIFTAHNIEGELTGQSECFGVSILEAMAAGLPVVGTRHGGVVESVVDGKTGFLNEPGDLEAQAESFLKLAADPELRQSMGEAGRTRVAQHFTPEQEAARLHEIMGIDHS